MPQADDQETESCPDSSGLPGEAQSSGAEPTAGTDVPRSLADGVSLADVIASPSADSMWLQIYVRIKSALECKVSSCTNFVLHLLAHRIECDGGAGFMAVESQ